MALLILNVKCGGHSFSEKGLIHCIIRSVISQDPLPELKHSPIDCKIQSNPDPVFNSTHKCLV